MFPALVLQNTAHVCDSIPQMFPQSHEHHLTSPDGLGHMIRCLLLQCAVDNTQFSPEGPNYPSAAAALAAAAPQRIAGVSGAGIISACNPAGTNYPRFFNALGSGSWLTVLPGATHVSFTSASLASLFGICGIGRTSAAVSPEAWDLHINDYVIPCSARSMLATRALQTGISKTLCMLAFRYRVGQLCRTREVLTALLICVLADDYCHHCCLHDCLGARNHQRRGKGNKPALPSLVQAQLIYRFTDLPNDCDAVSAASCYCASSCQQT
jgi:hypothetical protein